MNVLIILKPKPDMPDEEVTPEAILKECVIHGSSKTVLDKLIAFREHVEPFGTLPWSLDARRGACGADDLAAGASCSHQEK